MSTTTRQTTPPATPNPRHRAHSDVRVTQWRVIVAEWIKLRSLRSTLYLLLGAAVAVIGFALLASAAITGQIDGPPPRDQGPSGGGGGGFALDPTSISLSGVMLAQMIIGVLGVLVMSGEYATGMIRSSLSAVPKRLPVLWGKVIVLSAVTIVAMLVAVFTAFLVSQPILSSADLDGALSDDGVLAALVGAAVYVTGVGVLGIALGALLRNTAGAITTLFAALLVAPGLLGLVLPADWAESLSPFMPSSAGQSIMTVGEANPALLDPVAGLAVFIGYIVVLLAAAGFTLARRDA